MKTHTLDKERLRFELLRRGWKLNEYGAWSLSDDKSRVECEQDWVEAVEASVECQHESE